MTDIPADSICQALALDIKLSNDRQTTDLIPHISFSNTPRRAYNIRVKCLATSNHYPAHLYFVGILDYGDLKNVRELVKEICIDPTTDLCGEPLTYGHMTSNYPKFTFCLLGIFYHCHCPTPFSLSCWQRACKVRQVIINTCLQEDNDAYY